MIRRRDKTGGEEEEADSDKELPLLDIAEERIWTTRRITISSALLRIAREIAKLTATSHRGGFDRG